MLETFKVIATSLGTRFRTVLADLRGVGNDGADDDAEPYDDAEAVFPLGFVSRPYLPSGHKVRAVVLRMLDQVIPLAFEDKGLPKLTGSDLAEGEVLIFGPKESTARIRIKADGSITIDAKSASDVVVNGGTAKVSRVGDRTTGHAHTATFSLMAGMTPVTGTITIASNTDTMAEGADHFKA